MTSTATETHAAGQPLRVLASRFEANLAALVRRNPALAERFARHLPHADYFIGVRGATVVISCGVGENVSPIPDPVPPDHARRISQSVFKESRCDQPVAVVGAGYGWLWNSLYSIPPHDAHYQPPLYFLARDVEALYPVLHLQDWRTLLADPRVHLFVGGDAVEQFRAASINDPRLPLPRFSLDIDAALWPTDANYQSFFDAVSAARAEQRRQHVQRLTASYAWATDATLRQKVRSGAPLRVVGFASNRTTFLQHSMRDWLDAFAQLGHTTRLLIEEHPHEQLDELAFLAELSDFQPDVLLLLNHYRSEASWLPTQPMSVMWIQDDMPHLFTPAAGAKQTERDFVVGFGRQECTEQFGYAPSRFLSARVGVNERRFSPDLRPTPSELQKHQCDVSYVGHASTPADVLMQQCLRDAPGPNVARLLREVYDRLCAIYDAGGSISEALFLRYLIEDTAASLRLEITEAVTSQVTARLTHTVNNALFRHQSLQWIADAGLRLYLYGKGWESHPRLGRFARGVADNDSQLRTIYQGSTINLQVQPHGAVHQRLCDGLAAGGFFLLRYVGTDAAGPIYQRVFAFVESNRIEDDATLARLATPEVRRDLESLGWLIPAADADPARAFLDTLARHAATDFDPLRHTIWPSGADLAHVYRPLWAWCRSQNVTSDDEIRRLAPPAIRVLFSRIGHFNESERSPRGKYIVTAMRRHAAEGYDRFAASVFPGTYDRVVFRSRDELLQRVDRYLKDDAARAEVAESMRRVVLEKFTYRSVTRRLLDMMGEAPVQSHAATAA